MSVTVDIAATQAKLPTDLVEKPPALWGTLLSYGVIKATFSF